MMSIQEKVDFINSELTSSIATTKWWQNLEKYVIQSDNKNIMSMLKKVSKKRIRDKCRNNLLHYFARTNNEVMVDCLISARCNVNLKNRKGIQPLAIAVACNNEKVTKQLLDAGAIHTNSYFDAKYSLLHIAACTRSYSTIDILIKAGVDVKSVDKDGLTPLHMAIASYSENDRENSYKMINTLIEAGSDMYALTNDGLMPLHYACKCGYSDVVQLMLDAGAHPNAPDENSRTPLFYAVIKENIDTVKLLLQAGADINWLDVTNCTCLSHAVKLLNPELIKLILKNGAALDKEHCDPLLYVLIHCMQPLKRMIRERNVVPDYNTYNEIVDSLYSEEKITLMIKCMKILLKYGANINYVVKTRTPTSLLCTAYTIGHYKIVRFMLEHGAIFDYFNQRDLRNFKFFRTRSIFEILRHTAKFEGQSGSDGPKNFELQKLEEKHQNVYVRCRYEVKLMKIARFYENVSIFNILMDRDIGPYARNEDIVNAFTSYCTKQRFPLYYDLLIERFTKEQKKQELIKEAKQNLGRVLKWNVNSLCMIFDNIFRYLRKKDLYNLSKI